MVVLDDSTLQVMVDSVRVLDDKLLVLPGQHKGLPPEKSHKWHCSVVALFFLSLLRMCQYYKTRIIDIYEYTVK